MEVSVDLKSMYDSQYSDCTEEWRKIGAVGKAANIMKLTNGQSFASVLEVGAGDGNVLAQLAGRGFSSRLSAAEISDSAIRQIKKKGIPGLEDVRKFDGYRLPFAYQQFDLAICSHVLEHVEHPRELLREIRRVSRQQVFEVPIDFSHRVDKKFHHFYEYGHINIFTPALFNFLLYSEGFEVVKSKGTMYRREVIDFQYDRRSAEYFKIRMKRLLWKSLPVLMRLKPNVYTVLTR